MREVTERTKAVETGTVKLTGVNKDSIVKEARLLLDNPAYQSMVAAVNPYLDGRASQRIADFMARSHFSKTGAGARPRVPAIVSA